MINRKMEVENMRDTLKSKKYFDEFIEEDSKRIERFVLKLEKGEVRQERVLPVKRKIHDLKLGILIARYSKGDKISALKNAFIELCREWEEVFQPEYYNKNLMMISLAVLFDVGKEQIERMKNLLKNTAVEDWVFEFMLNAMLGHDTNENIPLLFPKNYMTLKQAAFTDKPIPLLKKYLSEEWYNTDCGCYEAHKSSQKIYYGYWSFEAGAFAKILQLDDKDLKKTPYYPYDMIHCIKQ